MNKSVEIEVDLIKYNPETHDYVGIYKGRKIAVDPYVGCVWEDDHRPFGTFFFKGDWYSLDGSVCLPSEEIDNAQRENRDKSKTMNKEHLTRILEGHKHNLEILDYIKTEHFKNLYISLVAQISEALKEE